MRTILLAVGLAALIGCGKKPKHDDTPSPSLPSATASPAAVTERYFVKLGKKGAGSKWRVTTSITTTVTGSGGGETDTRREQEKAEYVEHFIDPGIDRPNKITREYQYAQKAGAGSKFIDLPYSGKTVVIERVGSLYTFTVGGKKLEPAAVPELVKEFSGRRVSDPNQLMPVMPVGLNEEWEVERDVIRELARTDPAADADKTSIRGRLTKVYPGRGGRQWGVIEMTMERGLARPVAGMDKATVAIAMETPIDGGPPEGKQTFRFPFSMTTKDRRGRDVQVSGETVETKVVTPE